jgi:flagellar biosynthetic protein FliP
VSNPSLSNFPAASAEANHSRSLGRFLRHYAEMVVVMFAGMFVLGAPTGVVLAALGTSWSGLSPAMHTFVMALTMTVPMVAWMRVRGHSWKANIEMAASMLMPTAAVMGLLWAGAASSGSMMIPEHAAMLACMLAVMLARRDEYSCAAHGRHASRSVIAA